MTHHTSPFFVELLHHNAGRQPAAITANRSAHLKHLPYIKGGGAENLYPVSAGVVSRIPGGGGWGVFSMPVFSFLVGTAVL